MKTEILSEVAALAVNAIVVVGAFLALTVIG